MLFTPIDLQIALVQNILVWTQDMRFKTPLDRGSVPVPIGVFECAIPSYQSGPSAIQQQPKAPSIAVRCSNGFYRRIDGVAHVNFAILTWDDNLNRQGEKDVHNIMNRIAYGLMENAAAIDNAFVLIQDTVNEESITFELVEDATVDFFPYWVGMMTAKFGLFAAGPNAAPYNDVGPDTETWTKYAVPPTSPPASPSIVDPLVFPVITNEAVGD